MELYLDLLRKAADKLRPELKKQRLEVHAGSLLKSHALKVWKKEWMGSGQNENVTQACIFFSIWVNEESLKETRALYNIHAIRIRNLKGFKFLAQDFAAAFRARFTRQSKAWPNASVDFGPRTLMEGHFQIDKSSFENDAVNLVRRFVPLADTIDALLKARRVV
jgi:hypothetical protein